MGDAAPQGEENLQAVRIGRDAFLKGKTAFVLDVVLDIAFGKIRRMVPEIDEAVYGGGIFGGCLRVFRGFAGDEEHSFHHGKDGMAVVGLAHVFQAGEVEEREQLFERVFRLAVLEQALHVENTEE